MEQTSFDNQEAFSVSIGRKKQAPLGIASFVIASVYIAVMLGLLLWILFASGGEYYQAGYLMLTVFVVAAVPNIIGLVLGVVAMLQKEHKRGMAIAGAVINGIPLLVILIMIIVAFA